MRRTWRGRRPRLSPIGRRAKPKAEHLRTFTHTRGGPVELWAPNSLVGCSRPRDRRAEVLRVRPSMTHAARGVFGRVGPILQDLPERADLRKAGRSKSCNLDCISTSEPVEKRPKLEQVVFYRGCVDPRALGRQTSGGSYAARAGGYCRARLLRSAGTGARGTRSDWLAVVGRLLVAAG